MSVKSKLMNRLITKDDILLDIDFYRENYSDLSAFSNRRLKQHWQSMGKKEGRFPNIKEMLLSHGITDVEEFNLDLDLDFYLTYYPDLSEAGIKSLQQAKIHWLSCGKNENRYRTVNEWLDKNSAVLYVSLDELNIKKILNLNTDFIVTAADILNIVAGNISKPISIYGNKKKDADFYIQLGINCYLQYKQKMVPSILHAARSAWEMSFYFHNSDKALEHLGNSYLDTLDYRTAQKAYQSAILIGEDLSNHLIDNLLTCYINQNRASQGVDFLSINADKKIMERVAHNFFSRGDYQIAEKAYREALSPIGRPSINIIERALECCEKQFDFKGAIELLVSLQKKNPDFSYLSEMLKNTIQKFYWDYLGGIHMLATLDDRKGIKERVLECTKTIYDAYYSSYSNTINNPIKVVNTDKILIVGDYHVPQCIRYRINQKVEQLESQGKEVTTLDWMKLNEHQNVIALHDIVIFYRVPAVPEVLKAMAQVNANGKASFYEIDDLLFEESYPAPIESFGGYVSLSTHIELRKSMASFYAAAQQCRYGISSTRLLCEKLENLVMDKTCLLHRNGLDKLNVLRKEDKSHKTTIDIFYGSGTQAHNSDFIEQALPALERILDKHKNARLVIAGYLQLPADFTTQYKEQLQQIPPIKNVKAYWAFLAQADISLAVLNDDEINGCKSELKWFEAACFSIPSVVCTTANYRDVLVDGEDAFVASNEQQWFEALEQLITKPALRETMAERALERVKFEYSVEALGKNLVSQLEELLISPETKPKKKLALVNVFFPPQAIGGATRVVSDNFDILQQQYGDEYELVIFTSDDRCTTPYQLTSYQHQGVTVYRSTILYRENMDWHAQDPEMYKLFEQFIELEQPDLIHFHCVQRLTASVVEAAKDNLVPYVITAHDAWWISDHQFLVDANNNVYPDGHPDIFAPRTLPNNVTLGDSIERLIYYKELLKGAKNLLTVSESFADIYRKNGYPEIQVNKNGISSSVEWTKKQTEHTDKVVCAHIGGMANHKGYFLLKEAIEQQQPQNIEMLIVDHSKEDGYIEQALWGKVSVTFIGRVSQVGVTKLYQKTDVLFAPSMWPESYGLVTREAAACGCWVVASSIGGIGEDVIEGKTGLKVQPELNSLCKAVKTIDANAKKFKQYIEQTDIRMVDKQVVELVEIYQ
ncbi:MAG: glycosyltransferase involved in cell wall biosynthesis [Colwellia sp.]|jgi:glycosyltransferase involved in cell wall biosynthesis